jgi:hypothetical protein
LVELDFRELILRYEVGLALQRSLRAEESGICADPGGQRRLWLVTDSHEPVVVIPPVAIFRKTVADFRSNNLDKFLPRLFKQRSCR